MLGFPTDGGCSLVGKLCEELVGICCQLDEGCQLDDAAVFVSSSLVIAAFIINTCEVLAMDSSRNSSRGPDSFWEELTSQCCWVGGEGEGAKPE